jgi:hypothetical protein
MKKLTVASFTIFISIIIAGLYGIIHDQVTYSISQEYFSKFKFRQFGIDPFLFGGERVAVGIIGFLATWWVGLLIGLTIGIIGFLYPDHFSMKRSITNAIKIIFLTTSLFAIIGFVRGRYYLVKRGVDWWLPDDLLNKRDFITVGSIHNYSYLGGGLGLLFAIIYMLVKKASLKTESL